MSRKFKSLVALALAMMLVLAPTFSVSAAEADNSVTTANAKIELSLRSIFSAEYYAEKNPDVVEAFGMNEEALYRHYLTYGISEGRDMSPVINLKAYRDANPDLVEAFGDDWAAVLNHFGEFGVYETANGTRAMNGVLFNPVIYLRQHPEAELTTGGDLLKVIELFISEGASSGEWETTSVVDEFVWTPEDVPSADDGNSSPDYTADLVAPPVSEEAVKEPEEEPSDVIVKEPEEEPSDVPEVVQPVCEVDHTKLICGDKCPECDYVDPGHDFGPSGSDPYCHKCNADFVQIKGCAHEVWEGGSCVKCRKPDLHWAEHETYHVGEFCPDCKFEGKLLYDVGECPNAGSHDSLGDGESCRYCNYHKEQAVSPDTDDADDEAA